MAEDGLLHTTELLKTALPYVNVRSKLTLELLVKLYELIICIRNLRTKDITACGFENEDEKVDMETLLNKIRPKCNQKERTFVDKILNIFQAKRMFEMYNTYMEAMKTMEGFEGFSGNDTDWDSVGNFMKNFSNFDFSTIFSDDNNMDSDNPPDIDEDISKEDTSANDNNSMFESLKSMIPPEQIETFENLRMLFDSMSYDDNEKPESEENKE